VKSLKDPLLVHTEEILKTDVVLVLLFLHIHARHSAERDLARFWIPFLTFYFVIILCYSDLFFCLYIWIAAIYHEQDPCTQSIDSDGNQWSSSTVLSYFIQVRL